MSSDEQRSRSTDEQRLMSPDEQRSTSGTAQFRALGTRIGLAVTDAAATDAALALLHDEVAALDLSCSRFRDDSDLSRVNAAAGGWVDVGPLLVDAVTAALDAAVVTDGLVDPCLGRELCAAGYDRDFAALPAEVTATTLSPFRPTPRVDVDVERRRIRVTPGAALDLGATAKALGADRAARRIAEALGCGVLVDLGGDLSSAGPSPAEGWPVAVVDGDPARGHRQVVRLRAGGLATSSTVLRRWRCTDGDRHHILDPRTGASAPPVWRTVTVAAASCVDANTASTAAVVLGSAAPDWLSATGLPARLVAADRTVHRVNDWPAEETVRCR